MLRVTKRFNYLLVSPSRSQVASQPPMECIPLVMEPHSSFYHDPVVVLDFQVCRIVLISVTASDTNICC